MNLLLSNQIGSIIVLGIVILFLFASPFIMRMKNKKQMEEAQKMVDAIKKGDMVLTSTGVIGKVISIDKKEGFKTVTIETGNEHHKGYMCLDINAVYTNLSNPVIAEPTPEQKLEVVEDKKEEVVADESKEEVAEEQVEETAEEEVIEEQKPEAKKSQNKSTSKKSKNKK